MKTKFTLVALLIFLMSGLKSFSQQEILYLDNVNPVLTISFPDNWKCERKGEAFQAVSPDQVLFGQLWEDKKTSADKAIQNLDKIVEKYLTSLKHNVPKEVTSNNIKFTEVKCRAKLGTNDVEAMIYLFKIKNKNMVLLFYGATDKFKNFVPQINKVRASIAKH